ncbi:MAG: PAS domain-containing sensor histidine kinase [Bacteroidota bacterium]
MFKLATLAQDPVFRIMFQHATIGIMLADSNGFIVKTNDFANRLFGYEEGELEGQKIEVLVPDTLKMQHIRYREKYSKKPKEREMGAGLDLLAKRKDGSTFPVAISLGHTKMGEEQLVIAYINNVTKQKEYEERIKQEKETAQTYLDIAGSMVVVLNKAGQVQLLNQRGEEILGIKEEHVIGKNWFEAFLPKKERTGAKAVFNSLMSEQGRDVEYFENLIVDSQGNEKLIWFHNRVLLDKNGVATGTISSGVDITEQRQAEKLLKESQLKLEDYAAALESKVKERTMELEESQSQLVQALSKERELGELKSRFVSMASHEFRTPLSMVLSAAELIEMYHANERYDKLDRNVERIKSAVRNLTNILNDFLSLEKLEAGKIEVNQIPIELSTFLEELHEDIKPLLKKNQQLLLPSPSIITIQTDTYLLKNILINLISNAIKYSPDGEDVTLSINNDNGQTIFAVADQGIGIPETDKEHMFSRFFRAANAENIQGTGLGLIIVQRYVNLLGGHIDFTSEEGVGSTFYVRLPTS